jgi:hypothetical protein
MNEYARVAQVISSCVTQRQLDVAEKMAGLYQELQHRRFALSFNAYREVIRKPKELTDFIQMRREEIGAEL